MPSKPKKSLGFTLIELLVVIAIIGVLMAILMPALQAVRKQAWGITCQANLRSIGFACNFFSQDNDYKIPRGNDLGSRAPNGTTSRWHNVLLDYLEKKPDDADYRDVKVYNCPAYPDKDQTVCFVINSFDPDPAVERDTPELTPVDVMRDRAVTVYLADNQDGSWRPVLTQEGGPGWGTTDVFRAQFLPGYVIRQAGLVGAGWSQQSDLNYNGTRVAHARHRQGHNALFFDWHVAYVPAEESVAENWRPKLR